MGQRDTGHKCRGTLSGAVRVYCRIAGSRQNVAMNINTGASFLSEAGTASTFAY